MIIPHFAAIAVVLALMVSETLKVAAAISLRDVLSRLATRYEEAGGLHVDWAFGSSGQIVEQLRQGAPLDVLIVASREIANSVEKEKLVEAGAFVPIAGNRIVLAAPKDAKSPPKSFEELADDRIRRIAIGDPATVPVGDYAMQVLKHLKLDDKLKEKLVFGTNARQVLGYLARGEVDAGIVFSTDAALETATVIVIQEADEAWHKPVEYLAAPTKNNKSGLKAGAFVQLLCAEESQKYLQSQGFLPRARVSNQDRTFAATHPSSQPATAPAFKPSRAPGVSP